MMLPTPSAAVSSTLYRTSVHVPHRPQLETALKKGKGVTEAYPKSSAAKDILALWRHLDHLTKAKAPAKRRRAAP
jgi:hypothetical protein